MTSFDLAAFEPTESGPTGLFLDTSGLFAHFYPDAEEHEAVRSFFDAVSTGELPYRPLVTNTYVVDELATLLLSAGTHDHATAALETLEASEAITVRTEDETRFEAAREQFLAFDDQEISFTDHYCAIGMQDAAIDHVLAFDGDYETLGRTVIPRG